MTAMVKEGTGWRLAWDDERDPFKALAGGDYWALELTQNEFNDLCRLARQLADTMDTMAAELMPDERITCEQETPHVWMEVEGFHHSYSLRFILLQGRGGEGGWPPARVPEVLNGLDRITVF